MEEYFIPKTLLVADSFTVSFENATVYLIAHCMAELCTLKKPYINIFFLCNFSTLLFNEEWEILTVILTFLLVLLDNFSVFDCLFTENSQNRDSHMHEYFSSLFPSYTKLSYVFVFLIVTVIILKEKLAFECVFL